MLLRHKGADVTGAAELLLPRTVWGMGRKGEQTADLIMAIGFITEFI